MKIASSNSTVATNNNSQTSYDFNIGDVSTIIEILRNRLYSNPIQTLTQEYLSNARDSHREAGKADVSVRVTLPTKLESTLKIRDFGVGLTKDRVRDVFVNYGISTKRGDNVQTGGFGLGAKSAWAYTDSFVVVSYYNGVCSTYVAHTGKSSNGTFELISECETNEPNGVEVQIPVKEADIPKFVSSVYRTTMFWETKPELKGITDLELPKEYANPTVKYSKDTVLIVPNNMFNQSVFDTSTYSNKAYLLIDSIPYNISKFHYQIENLRSLTNIVHGDNIVFIKVDNGIINIAASREEVSSDVANLEKINNVCKNASLVIYDIVKSEFDKDFKSVQDYMKCYSKVRETFHCNNIPKDRMKFEYEYEDIKFELRGLVDNFKCDKFESIANYYVEEQENRSVIRCEVSDMIRVNPNTKIVLVDADLSSIISKRKAKKLLEEDVENVYFVKCDPKHFDNLKKCANAILLSGVKHDSVVYRAKKRLEGIVCFRPLVSERSYRSTKVESQGKKEMTLSQMENEGKFVVVPFGADEKYDYTNNKFISMVSYLTHNHFTVIKCSKKDYELLSDLDNVHDYDDVVSDLETYVPIPDESIEATVFSRMTQNLFSLRSCKKIIICPKIQELFGLYEIGANDRNRLAWGEEILQNYKHYKIATKKFEKLQNLEEEVCEMYPLLENMHYHYHYNNSETQKEIAFYINCKYQSLTAAVEYAVKNKN